MRKVYSLLAMFLFLFVFLSVQASAESYTQSQTFDLLLYHTDYPACASLDCNITLFSPNNTLIFADHSTTQNLGYSNSTILSTDIPDTGTYNFVLSHQNGTYKGSFEITPTGTIPGISSSLIAIFAIALMLVMGSVLIFIGHGVINNNPRYWFFGILAIGLGLLLFYFDTIQIFVLLRDVAYATHTAHAFERLLPKIATIQKVLAWTFLLFFVGWVIRIFQKISKARSNNDGWDSGKY